MLGTRCGGVSQCELGVGEAFELDVGESGESREGGCTNGTGECTWWAGWSGWKAEPCDGRSVNPGIVGFIILLVSVDVPSPALRFTYNEYMNII